MSRFARGGWFPSENCFLNKKAKLLIQVISLLFNLDAGNELSFQAVARQVFSPLRVFTTVFGMGTGGFLLLGHQQTFVCCLPIILGFQLIRWKLHKIQYHHFFNQLQIIALRYAVTHFFLLRKISVRFAPRLFELRTLSSLYAKSV